MPQLKLVIYPDSITQITVSGNGLTQTINYDSSINGFDITDFGINSEITVSAENYAPETIEITEETTELELYPYYTAHCYLRLIQPDGITRRCKLIYNRVKRDFVFEKINMPHIYGVNIDGYTYTYNGRKLVLTKYVGSGGDLDTPIMQEM